MNLEMFDAVVLMRQWAVWSYKQSAVKLGYPSTTPFRKMYHVGQPTPFVHLEITDDEALSIDSIVARMAISSPFEYLVMKTYFKCGECDRRAAELLKMRRTATAKRGALKEVALGAAGVVHSEYMSNLHRNEISVQ